MSQLKKLASQTAWYGLSNILPRMLTFLLTPFLTNVMTGTTGQIEYGRYGLLYAWIPIFNVLYTYGMETAFFRFSNEEENGSRSKLYNTQVSALIFSSLLFSALLIAFRFAIAGFVALEGMEEYITWTALILAGDTLAALPSAMLRKEGRPKKYAFTRIAGVLAYVGIIVFLFLPAHSWAKSHVNTTAGRWLLEHWGVGYIVFANLVQSFLTLLLLWKELALWRPELSRAVMKKVIPYSLPILVAGFAGQFNDSLNRVMFMAFYPAPENEQLRQLAYLNAVTKLTVMINLGIQAFRMAAEPFFFSVARNTDAKHTYARVMQWFVIVLAVMFLSVALYMDLWKYFLGKSGEYWQALYLAPVLLLAAVFLGIYYNLTIWYKLTDRTYFGAVIMIFGAGITTLFNYIFIPHWGYDACAWSMLVSYGSMMLLSYALGQKYYPIPYRTGGIMALLGIMLALYGLQWLVMRGTESLWLRLLSGTGLMLVFLCVVFVTHRRELKAFPLIGRFIK